MDNEEILKEVTVLAEKKYGRPFSALSEDEKNAIFRDYVTDKEKAGARYDQGAELMATAMPQGRQVGDIYQAASPWEMLGNVAQRGVGAYQQKTAMDEMGDIAGDFSKGSRAAGDVAAHNQGQQMSMMAQMLRGGQQAGGTAPPPPQGPPPVQQVQQPMAPQGPTPPQQGGGQPGGQMGLAPGQPGAPPPNAPMMLPGGQPQMPSGGPVPKNREEWQAYLLRNMNGGGY